MPAELDQRTEGEGTAMFYVGATPWHRSGRPLHHPPSVTRALIEGGLDWRVERRPMWTTAGPLPPEVEGPDHEAVEAVGGGGEGRVSIAPVPDAYAVCRCDREGPDSVLGVVGGRYRVLQNEDAFAPFRPLIADGLVDLETGGVLRGGRQVWMLGRFQPERLWDRALEKAHGAGASSEEIGRLNRELEAIFEGKEEDRIEPYALVTNSHDGGGSAQVRETPIRVVCANTLSLALNGKGKAISIRHTGAVDEKVREAAEDLWGGIVDRYRRLAELFPVLRRARLSEGAFDLLVLDSVEPLKPESELETPQAEAAQERRKERRAVIRRLWTAGAGHVGDESAWEAYNGLVQALDHSEAFQPSRSSRVQSLMDGSLEDAKRRVGNRLVRYATEGSFRAKVLARAEARTAGAPSAN